MQYDVLLSVRYIPQIQDLCSSVLKEMLRHQSSIDFQLNMTTQLDFSKDKHREFRSTDNRQ